MLSYYLDVIIVEAHQLTTSALYCLGDLLSIQFLKLWPPNVLCYEKKLQYKKNSTMVIGNKNIFHQKSYKQ